MADFILYFTELPIFGIVLTLSAFAAGRWIYSKLPLSFLHPVLTASVIIIVFLELCNIDIDAYQNGGRFISFLLGPATVALALPLYQKIDLLKRHFIIILVAIAAGAVSSVISVVLLSRAFGLPQQLALSLVPKSITTPIAVEASAKLGGFPPVTAIAVIITGITGAVAGPLLLKLLRVNSPAAKGLAMGTSSHAIGTSRALEMGQTEGALSSLSIGLAGIITVVSAPFLIGILF